MSYCPLSYIHNLEVVCELSHEEAVIEGLFLRDEIRRQTAEEIQRMKEKPAEWPRAMGKSTGTIVTAPRGMRSVGKSLPLNLDILKSSSHESNTGFPYADQQGIKDANESIESCMLKLIGIGKSEGVANILCRALNQK